MKWGIIIGLLVVGLGVVFFFSGSTSDRDASGTPPSGQAESYKATRLRKLLDTPVAYRDKEVILDGHFANVCCQNCFAYKEGVDSLEIQSEAKEWHHYKPGTPIRVAGTFRVVDKQTAEGGTERFLHVEASTVEKR